MKNAFEIEMENPGKYSFLINYDKIEIDNPDKNDPRRIRYMARLIKIVEIIMARVPHGQGLSVGDFACAQGNMGLLLAEYGYQAKKNGQRVASNGMWVRPPPFIFPFSWTAPLQEN
jgi:hypothetical protein